MNLRGFLSLLKKTQEYGRLLDRLRHKTARLDVKVLHAAKPFLLAGLQEELSVPMAILTSRADRARALQEEIGFWNGDPESVLVLPEPDSLPFERNIFDLTANRERLRTLDRLATWDTGRESSGNSPIVVVSGYGLMQRLPTPSDYVRASHVLKVGQKLRLDQLVEKWVSMGFEHSQSVEVPGTFCRRGGIIDVFPPTDEFPSRIEFFGDAVESIRLFDPITQRSTQLVQSVTVSLARSVAFPGSAGRSSLLSQMDFSSCNDDALERFTSDLSRLENGAIFEGSDFYAPFFNNSMLFDYLPETSVVLIDDLDHLEVTVHDLENQADELRQNLLQRGDLPGGFPSPVFTWEEIAKRIDQSRRKVQFSFGERGDVSGEGAIEFPFYPLSLYGGRLKVFLNDVKALRDAGNAVVICSQQIDRLADLLSLDNVIASVNESVDSPPGKGTVSLVRGSLGEGWFLRTESGETGALEEGEGYRTALFTDQEIFGFSKPRRAVRKRATPRDVFVMDLAPGDYAVHIEHGICRFAGMTSMTTDGIEREYLVLEYAAGDTLYVPTDQVDRVRRFIGSGEGIPNLTRLGTQDWLRVKERAKKAAREMARELLDIYSAREVSKGFAFSEDSVWQREVEASFPYVETADQLEAIEAVKADMEIPRPMDRLICGDVGYGKTEVAVRATFKAVMDGKQVGVLVPTTVLAQQHFQTFSQRMAAFPIRIEVLSRFRSDKEQKQVIDGLRDGTVDICIGTHRLIQKDVQFKDLGLLVIDEEQRFGVVHKEKLKQMRKEVDVLTLTATPIPRTLHMSLTGIRDMSTMETPPEERLSIKTYVTGYDERLIREVILRELDRGGQVFFVHNRVHNIEFIAHRLRTLVPEAEVAIGHGQMPEEQLEKVMADFSAGKYDVLVCTTIIESGLDMPNVNTIIINQADKFGLAQLYQLRGRVGRGANRAYAYFLYNKDKSLTETAEKRLRTIFEATELSSGFRIAMKDLEIRGAGNLLGPQQSGHINAIGFDLYTRLLAQAVEELKRGEADGKSTLEKTRENGEEQIMIDLPLPALIPHEYVPDEAQRLALYQKLSVATTLEDVEDVAQELRDRFGESPQPVKNLLYLLEIKIMAKKGGVTSITARNGDILIKIGSTTRLVPTSTSQSVLAKAITFGYGHIRLNMGQVGRKWPEALRMLIESTAQT